jgi:hypothetical protein
MAKWVATETYTDEANPRSERKRRTVEFEVDTVDPMVVATQAYSLIRGSTGEEVQREFKENGVADQLDGVDLEDEDPEARGFEFEYYVAGGGSYHMAVEPVVGPRVRTVLVRLRFQVTGEESVEGLEMFYGQQVELAVRAAGLDEGKLVSVESEVVG